MPEKDPIDQLRAEIAQIRQEIKELTKYHHDQAKDAVVQSQELKYANVTLSEIKGQMASEARVAALEARVKDLEVEIEGLPEKYASSASMADLEAWKTWVLRLVLGAVITAVLGLVIIK